jgi:hypothetical protein
LPLTSIEVSVIASSAPPLNLPADFAAVTFPETLAPCGTTTLPLTTIGAASEALTGSPTLLSFELMSWSIVTLMFVPVLTTIGGGGAGACCVGAAACSPAVPGLPPFGCEEWHP